MPMSTRELYLVLRARDEASRTLRGLSRELLTTGAAAAAAAQRAESGIKRETAARARREAQMARDLAARYRAAAANEREQASLARMNGTSQASLNTMRQRAIQYDRLARQQEVVARGHDRTARAAMAEATAMEQSARMAEESALRHRHMISIVEQSGQAMATAGLGFIAAGVVAAAGIKELVDVSVEYERQVRHTATQVDGFAGNLQQLGDIGRRAARDFAVPFESIQPALFDIFSSTEASVGQSEMLLRAFAKAAVAGQVDIQDASRATIGLLNAFSLPLEDVNRVLDIQFQLVKEGVGDYSEWADKIGLVSPSAARAGQSIEVMTAALATATRMGMTAARASTSVARALDAMSNPKVIDNLKELGVKSRDASGHMRPLNDVLRDFRSVLMKMPEKDRVGVILDVFKGAGGTIEARRFLQTMLLVPGTLEQFDQILGNIENSAGSMDKAYDVMSNSVASQTQLLQNRWMLLKESLGTALTPAFMSVVNVLNMLLGKFNELSPHTKEMIANALLWGTGLSIAAGIILTVVGALAVLVAAVAAAGSVLFVIVGIIAAVVAGVAGLSAGLYALYNSSGAMQTYFKGGIDLLRQFWDVIKGVAASFRDEWSNSVNPALQKLGQYITEWVVPAFTTFRNEVGGKALEAFKSFMTVAEGVGRTLIDGVAYAITNWVLPAVAYLTEQWIAHRDQIMPVISILITLVKWFGIIAAVVVGVVALALGTVLFGAIIIAIRVIGFLITIIGDVIGFLKSIPAAVRQVIDIFKVFGVSAMQYFGMAADYISGIPGKIRGYFSGFGGMLMSAGRELIGGLIDGIRQKIGELQSVLSTVTSLIPSWKGPMSRDKKLLVPTGKAIMGGLVNGIRQALPAVQAALGGVTTSISSFGGSDDKGNGFRDAHIPPPPPDAGTTKNYYITQNITTQEISPVRQAAELGWEVQTVV
jgi:TP901 family phage tail tape measure protein